MGYIKVGVVAFLGLAVLASPGRAQDAADLPAGPGQKQLIASCTACHALTQVTTQLHTQPQWADIVDQMVARGATVSDDDYPLIVRYLGEHFGPAARKAPAAPSPR